MKRTADLRTLAREARDAWEANASWWVERMRREAGGDPLRREVLNGAILSMVPDRCTVLDLACGEGYLSHMIVSRVALVVGLDWSSSMIRAARRTVACERSHFVVGDSVGHVPFRTSSFGLVIGNMVAMDIIGLEPALAEARRVVGPTGRGIWTVLDPDGVTAQPHKYFEIVRRLGVRVPQTRWAAWVRIAPDQPSPTLYLHRDASMYCAALDRTGWTIEGIRRLGGGAMPGALLFDVRGG